MLIKKQGFRTPSQTFARIITTCPICTLTIEPGDSILNPGIEPPPDDRGFWWCHAACAAQLYPNPPQLIPNSNKCWLYLQLDWLAKPAAPHVAPVQATLELPPAKATTEDHNAAPEGGAECETPF
jgi:hypothetical protein